ncbi:Flp pilus assembly protein CpaB [Methylophaga lonarensis]|uniref:Flp pilus assembly protein CpaB n=1 Tax=Methylophaga lonarensis TaxID=999151 RepID=UPI003D2E796C
MSSSVLRVLALLLAVAAAVVGYLGYQVGQGGADNGLVTEATDVEPVVVEAERYPITIAARDIETGRPITDNDVTTIFVDRPFSDAFTESQAVIGRVPRMDIAVGDMLLPGHFPVYSTLTQSIRSGERAMAIRVDEVVGAGGFIEPGDYVDVLLFLQAGQETGRNSSAQLLLSNIRVLAFGDALESFDRQQIRTASRAYASEPAPDTSVEATANDDASGKQSKTAVLAIDQADVSALLLAESTGRIRLALVGAEAGHEQSLIQEQDDSATPRQFITTKSFSPAAPAAEAAPVLATPVAPVRRAVASPPTPSKIVVHRGSQETTVTLDQEN